MYFLSLVSFFYDEGGSTRDGDCNDDNADGGVIDNEGGHDGDYDCKDKNDGGDK